MKLISNKKVSESIQNVEINLDINEELKILWLEDLHFENPDTDKTKLKKILDKNPDHLIGIGGDAFDLMDSFGDPRQSKGRIGKNGFTDNYVNDVLSMFVDFFQPYANRILCVNFGNHEGSFLKRYGTDIGAIAAAMLNDRTGSNIVCGDYAGYINFSFLRRGVKNDSRSKVLYYTHSSGSIGKRSKGALSVDILKGQHPSADMIVWGHDHETLIKPESVETMSRNKQKLEDKFMWFISAPTVKDEFSGAKRGFHHEKNMGKRVIGVIEFSFVLRNSTPNFVVDMPTPKYHFFRDY